MQVKVGLIHSGQVCVYDQYASNSNSNFMYNSSNSSYPSAFSFSYSNGTNSNSVANGATYNNKQHSNTLYSSTNNNDTANITTANITTLNLSNGINWSNSPYGSMTLLSYLSNCNLSQGGSQKTYNSPLNGLYLFVANNGSNSDYTLQYIFMVFFTTSDSNLVTTYNNPSARRNLGTSTTSRAILIWNSGYSSSYTSFYLYGVRLF
jgi:hypothetical protein